MHLMCCRVIFSQRIKSRCSLSSKNKCIFQGFHAFLRLSRLRELARRAQYAISDYHNVGLSSLYTCFLASLTSFFPLPSPGRVLSSAGKFQATDLPDVPRLAPCRREGPLGVIVGTRLGSSPWTLKLLFAFDLYGHFSDYNENVRDMEFAACHFILNL